MKTNAAIVWGLNQKWEVEEVDLDGPKQGEVLVKLSASGLCRSDDHLVTGDMPMPLPAVGGHEGAGIVVETGRGVTDVVEGDAVVFSFLPACGKCPPCRMVTQFIHGVGDLQPAILGQQDRVADTAAGAADQGFELGTIRDSNIFEGA